MSFSAVVTTGIYCRDGCGARPLPHNVERYRSAAGAEAAGYRACLRCRPYRVSEPIGFVGADDLVCRAIQLILDGSLDSGTEHHLGAKLGVSARHLRRLFLEHLGATPTQLARSRRAHFARRLLDETDLSFGVTAYASGFGSVRQFNREMLDTFGAAPRELRARRRRTDRLVADGGLAVRLPYIPPLDWSALIAFFAKRAIEGVESVTHDVYRRTVLISGHPGVVEVEAGDDASLIARLHLPRWEGLIHHTQRIRRMFDLDRDPETVNTVLGADRILGPLVADRPGLRVPGAWDPFEVGVRAIVGQQISVTAASTIVGRIASRFGDTVPGLAAIGLSRTFPDPSTLARADLTGIGLTAKRADAIRAFACAIAAGRVVLDPGIRTSELISSLTALPGIGRWTASYIAMRLGDPDAFPKDDLGIRRAMATNGSLSPARDAETRAEAWRPWRAYAAMHLVHSDLGSDGVDGSRSRGPARTPLSEHAT